MRVRILNHPHVEFADFSETSTDALVVVATGYIGVGGVGLRFPGSTLWTDFL
ncbi:MAG: hypothetical protein AAFX10_04385 [Pseudomonadota bacterium]